MARAACVGNAVAASACAAQTGAAPKGNPRLASLKIEIWPEFDRPAALVILNAALAEGVKLPAAVTLRLPAASGGATAVAYSATADGNLLNLKNERAMAGEFVTLKFDVPERFFHVEFYEPIATTASARTYSYVWPGDLAVEQLTVLIQEPASATDISVEPNLEGVSTGEDGLRYRGAELGPLEAGKRLPIAVRYTKADARPSADILKPKAAPVVPPLAAPPPPAPADCQNGRFLSRALRSSACWVPCSSCGGGSASRGLRLLSFPYAPNVVPPGHPAPGSVPTAA